MDATRRAICPPDGEFRAHFMGDREPRDPWDLSRLGEEDFVSEPLDSHSTRRQPRDPDSTPTGSTPQPPGRRMRHEEREALRRQARDSRQVPPEYFGREAVPPKRRWPRWGGVALILLAIIVAGNIGLLRNRGEGNDPTPASDDLATSTAMIAVVDASPTVPPNTPTPEATATTAPSPTPTPEPTSDPRFAGVVVCLDPGHGGRDRGYERSATDAAPAMEEAPFNLEFALAVRERLEAYGFDVILTRTEDVDVNEDGSDVNLDGKTRDNQSDPLEAESAEALDELQARINVCNDAGADLLVSLHINGYPDASVSGFETWYSTGRPFVGQNRLIASLLYDELRRSYQSAGYNVPERGVRDDSTVVMETHQDLFDSYVITGPSQPGAIVASAMPGAIAEVLFISSETDAPILTSELGRQAIIDAYVRAIVAYFQTTLGPGEIEE